MMDSNNAIEVRNVSKHFKVYYDKGSQLKERVLFRKRNAYENRVVLDNISFSIKKGEAVGLQVPEEKGEGEGVMAFVDDSKVVGKLFGKKLYISVSESVVFRNP